MNENEEILRKKREQEEEELLNKRKQKETEGAIEVDGKIIPITINDIDAFEKAYRDFHNGGGNVETHEFKDFDSFLDSDYYKSLSDEEKEKYSEDNFPKQVKIFYFDSKEDLIDFLRQIQEPKVGIVPQGTAEHVEEQLGSNLSFNR